MAINNKLSVEIIEPTQFWNVVAHLPKPASLMTDRGSFYDTVDDMICDAKIGSHLRMRKDIVASFPFNIDQKKSPDNVYQFIKDNLFTHLNWEIDVKELLSAIEYGFSFSEILWKEENGYIVPDSLRSKKPDQIVFRTDYVPVRGGRKSIWVPVLATLNKDLIENRKFLIYRNNPRAENPYGNSDMTMCYWPWRFKQFGWEFWLEAAKKAGVPSIVALFDAPDDKKAAESANLISSTLEQIEGGSGIALSNVKEVKTLEMGGVLSDHKVLIETCNQEISFALTTQSLSTQEGEYGTRAQATVHDENLIRVCHGDAKALTGTLQQLIDWMVELNFGKNVPSPKGEFDLESYATFEEVIKAVDANIPVSKEKLYTRYGLPRPKDDEDSYRKESTTLPTTQQNSSLSKTESTSQENTSEEKNIQSAALNGAQVNALVELANKVRSKELPLESAKALAAAAFPILSKNDIEEIFSPELNNEVALDDKKKARSKILIG